MKKEPNIFAKAARLMETSLQTTLSGEYYYPCLAITCIFEPGEPRQSYYNHPDSIAFLKIFSPEENQSVRSNTFMNEFQDRQDRILALCFAAAIKDAGDIDSFSLPAVESALGEE